MADHAGHTHAPGEAHSHSHAPQTPAMPPIDPAMQALIDQSFVPVPLETTSDNNVAVCAVHKLEKCDDCVVDFLITNRLSRLLAANPNLLCPPPSNVQSQKLTQMVTSAKEEGNTLFKAGHAAVAIQRYTTAASIAIQRPPWESNQLMREELSTVVSNRSAAYLDIHDYVGALADAETVISIRKNWSKGHFRKAKALVGLHRYQDAAEAIRLGLSFEPTNQELLTFLADVERMQKKLEERKLDSLKMEPPAATAVNA